MRNTLGSNMSTWGMLFHYYEEKQQILSAFSVPGPVLSGQKGTKESAKKLYLLERITIFRPHWHRLPLHPPKGLSKLHPQHALWPHPGQPVLGPRRLVFHPCTTRWQHKARRLRGSRLVRVVNLVEGLPGPGEGGDPALPLWNCCAVGSYSQCSGIGPFFLLPTPEWRDGAGSLVRSPPRTPSPQLHSLTGLMLLL